MSIKTRELYMSENGDRWSHAQDTNTGRTFVRHEANLASGGNLSDKELSVFLGQGGLGPEKQALLRLMGCLIEDVDESGPRTSASAS